MDIQPYQSHEIAKYTAKNPPPPPTAVEPYVAKEIEPAKASTPVIQADKPVDLAQGQQSTLPIDFGHNLPPTPVKPPAPVDVKPSIPVQPSVPPKASTPVKPITPPKPVTPPKPSTPAQPTPAPAAGNHGIPDWLQEIIGLVGHAATPTPRPTPAPQPQGTTQTTPDQPVAQPETDTPEAGGPQPATPDPVQTTDTPDPQPDTPTTATQPDPQPADTTPSQPFQATGDYVQFKSQADPHITTTDGTKYDNSSVGDYTLINSKQGSGLNVQVHNDTVDGRKGVWQTQATVTTGGDTVSYDAAAHTVTINGQTQSFAPGQSIDLPGGGSVQMKSYALAGTSASSDTVVVNTADGDHVNMLNIKDKNGNPYLDVSGSIDKGRTDLSGAAVGDNSSADSYKVGDSGSGSTPSTDATSSDTATASAAQPTDASSTDTTVASADTGATTDNTTSDTTVATADTPADTPDTSAAAATDTTSDSGNTQVADASSSDSSATTVTDAGSSDSADVSDG